MCDNPQLNPRRAEQVEIKRLPKQLNERLNERMDGRQFIRTVSRCRPSFVMNESSRFHYLLTFLEPTHIVTSSHRYLQQQQKKKEDNWRKRKKEKRREENQIMYSINIVSILLAFGQHRARRCGEAI